MIPLKSRLQCERTSNVQTRAIYLPFTHGVWVMEAKSSKIIHPEHPAYQPLAYHILI